MVKGVLVRIALCQINVTVGDLRRNTTRIRQWYERAAAAGADLVAFPELAVTGYPPRDLLDRREFRDATAAAVRELVATSGPSVLVFGAPLPNPDVTGKSVLNGAVACRDGAILAEVSKKLIPTYDVFDEGRYFDPGPSPAAPIVLDGVHLGLHICEDAWNEEGFWEERLYRHDPVADLVRGGANLLLNVSASPFHGRKGPLRRRMIESHVRRHRVPYLYTNLVGGNDELIFDGEAFAFDASAHLVAKGVPFVEEILYVDVEGGRVAPAGSWTREGISHRGTGSGTPESEELPEMEAVRQALVLGLRDYVRKCGLRSAVLGLSGGIDSSLTAVIAAQALGPEAVLGVSLPSRYSSPGSLNDAEALARNLGIRYEVLSIEPVFEASLQTLRPLFGEGSGGIAEENLQARARGNLLMGLSNRFGHLLLTTGNKSEIATGYCTLYGDMAGGLAVIADLPKTTVYELARWINREREIIPQAVLLKPPSAELRPGQRDDDSLPSYGDLDAVLEAYVERGLGVRELVATGFDPELVERVLAMVAGAEYKRRQAPPGLRVSPKAFGSGRRMPIATPWPRPEARME